MDQVFLPYTKFLIMYIDDILIFNKCQSGNLKHLHIFYEIVYEHGWTILASKMFIGERNIQFLLLRFRLKKLYYNPKFLRKLITFHIINKTQLQRFIRCISYNLPFYLQIVVDRKLLNHWLQKTTLSWTSAHTYVVQNIIQQ